MAGHPNEDLKLFRFAGPKYGAARWMRLSNAVVAAHSLAAAKQTLKAAGISASGDWNPIKITSTDEAATLALANPGQIVWSDVDDHGKWRVGGPDCIADYIKSIWGDGPYPQHGPRIQ